MTQPGTLSHEVKRGDDYVVRSIADIYRKLRRLGAAVASGVQTGTQGDDTAVSISSTSAGDGNSYADTVGAVAVGDASDANDASAVAVGKDSYAAAVDSVAIGRNAQANATGGGDSGIVIGADAATQDVDAVAIGHSALTLGYSPASRTDGLNVAIGPQATVRGDYSVCIGAMSSTSTKGVQQGRSAVAIGRDAHTQGFQTVAVGLNATATADGSIAIGTCSATGTDAVAIGTSASATNANDFALGNSSHNVKIVGRLNVARRTPTSSADTQGSVGDITSDDSYVYAKTSTGWKRAALSTF